MTITPVGFTPFAGSVGGLTHVSPFTHRDNATFLTILKGIIDYINTTQVPHFNAELQRIIDEFNTSLNNTRADWFEMFNDFIINIEAELSALNDTSVANLLADAESATGTKIRDLFGYEYNVKHYGALGNGNAGDDAVAIRNTINAAAAAAIALGGKTTVIIPPGRYRMARGTELSWVFPGDGQFSKYWLEVPSNVIIQGAGGVIVYDCDYDNRTVVFYVSGSNVVFDNVITEDIYNMAGGSRPTGIPIAGGDAYDASLAVNLSNIVIRNCTFIRPWYPTKFGATKENGTTTITDVAIYNCLSQGEPASAASGGYNFTSRVPGRVKGVTVNGNRCFDVTVSAAIGLYGVHDFTVTGNRLRGSNINGAGIQTENGAFNGTISGNVLIDHYNHVWLDDSNDITVSGNKMRNTTADNSFKGVRITYQGFDGDISHKSGDHQITGNNLKNCAICTESFSNPQAGGTPSIGSVSITGNTLNLDGAVIQHGIRTGSADAVLIADNTVTGASLISIRLAPNIGQEPIVVGNLTRKIGAEASVGIDIITLNASHPIVSDNRFVNGEAATLTYVSSRVGTGKIIRGTGAPEDAVSGNPGDLFINKTATSAANALYAKTNTGLVGWASLG